MGPSVGSQRGYSLRARFRALALVHRLHPGDGDRVPLLDQLGGQLWARAAARATGRRRRAGPARSHGEVGRHDRVEVVPRHRERHGQARADPRAVGRDDGRAAGAGGVEEHLAAAVLADERRRRDRRVEALGAGGDRPGRRGGVLDAGPPAIGTNDVHALGPAGLHGAGQPDVGRARGGPAGRRRRRRRSRRPRAGRGRARGASSCRLAGRGSAPGGTRPRAGSPATAACGGRCTARRCTSRCDASAQTVVALDPVRGVLGQVLLHERRLAGPHPNHRQRPVAQPGQDALADRVEVVDQVALVGVGARRTTARRGWSARRRRGISVVGLERPCCSFRSRPAGGAPRSPRPG